MMSVVYVPEGDNVWIARVLHMEQPSETDAMSVLALTHVWTVLEHHSVHLGTMHRVFAQMLLHHALCHLMHVMSAKEIWIASLPRIN